MSSKGALIGVKYCGGCNPRFDRAGFVRCIGEQCPWAIFEPVSEGRTYTAVIIICGCPAQCVKHEKILSENGVFFAKCPEDEKDAIGFLKDIYKR